MNGRIIDNRRGTEMKPLRHTDTDGTEYRAWLTPSGRGRVRVTIPAGTRNTFKFPDRGTTVEWLNHKYARIQDGLSSAGWVHFRQCAIWALNETERAAQIVTDRESNRGMPEPQPPPALDN